MSSTIKQFSKTFSAILVALVAGVCFALPAYAQVLPLSADFQQDPLFSESDFLPGNTVSRTITVANHSGSSQQVAIEAINATDGDGLGDQLDLTITDGATTLYTDTLGTFLRAGEVPLSTIADGVSTVYTLTVSFKSSADNATQNAMLGFDLCVGYQGQDGKACGDTTIGGEGSTGGGGTTGTGGVVQGTSSAGGGGGGGGIVPPEHLVITNDHATALDLAAGTATIVWDTNLLSTSQVVYGPQSGGPYSLSLIDLPYFGYPSGTVEDSHKMTQHAVELTGLTPGETYLFRVVSRASPPTVGFQRSFVFSNTPAPAPTLSVITTNGVTGGTNPLSPASTTATATPPVTAGGDGTGGSVTQISGTSTATGTLPVNLASALFALPENWSDLFSCGLPWNLLALVVIAIIYRLIGRGGEGRAPRKAVPLFLAGMLVAYVLFILFSITCASALALVITLLLFLSYVAGDYRGTMPAEVMRTTRSGE